MLALRVCFSTNEYQIEVSLKAPLCKSDHAFIEIEVKMKPHVDYLNRKQRNWSKLTEDLVSGMINLTLLTLTKCVKN